MASQREPQSRLIVLGASNVARGVAPLLSAVRALLPGPVDLMMAMGHGRSYSRTTSIPFRSLPGILHCGIWDALEHLPPLPTYALLTDIGNDLIYGASAEQTVNWVSACVDRLRPYTREVILTGVPLASIVGLTERRFKIYRRLFFPSSALTLTRAIELAHELESRLRAMSARENIALVEPLASWYGTDPIHIRSSRKRDAWQQLLSALTKSSCAKKNFSNLSARDRMRLFALRPLESRSFNRMRIVAQPCVVLSDAARVSFY